MYGCSSDSFKAEMLRYSLTQAEASSVAHVWCIIYLMPVHVLIYRGCLSENEIKREGSPSLPAGQRPEPLVNPMSSTTQAYLRMASRSARNPSMDNLAEASELMLLLPIVSIFKLF